MQIDIDSFAAAIPDPITVVGLTAAERVGVSTLPHAKMMHAIELLGERVSPMVREELSVSAQ